MSMPFCWILDDARIASNLSISEYRFSDIAFVLTWLTSENILSTAAKSVEKPYLVIASIRIPNVNSSKRSSTLRTHTHNTKNQE